MHRPHFNASLAALPIAALILAPLPALAQSAITNASFSMNVPSGWNVTDFAGSKFKIAHDKPANGFAANINIVEEKYQGSIDRYADATEKQIATIKGYKKLGRSAFNTTSGVKGVRLAFSTEQQSRTLRQVAYLLPGKASVFVVTASALAEDGGKRDAAWDSCAKTFKLR